MKGKKVTIYITYAMFELLKSKRLEDITTSEIIQKAGVCRSSFYRNFYLPEDIIRQYGVALFEEIYQKTPNAQAGLRAHIQSFCELLWHERERLALLENRGLFYLLEEPIMDFCRRQIEQLGAWSNRYHTEFYAGASAQLLRAWIHNGFEESPTEMADVVCELISNTATIDWLHPQPI